MNSITINKGKLQAIDAPEKPKHINIFTKSGMDEFYSYEEKFKKAIAEAVDFRPEDYDFVYDLLWKLSDVRLPLKEGEIYPRPEGYKIEIGHKCIKPYNNSEYCEYPECIDVKEILENSRMCDCRYAKLVPVKEQEKDTIEKLLKESHELMHDLVLVLNGSYQLKDRYFKLIGLIERIEKFLYTYEHNTNH